jgi:uncharacterized protein (TIRG00374 family)
MTKKVLFTVLKVGVSATLLYLLFRSIEVDAFVRVLATIKPQLFVLVIFLFAGIQAVSGLRWAILLKKDVDLPYLKVLSMYFIGMFFNNFLPTLVGGDVVKGYYLYRETGKGDVAAASVLMDRYSGFTALMAITLVALVPGYVLIKGTGLAGFFLLLVGGYVVASCLVWVEFLHGWLVKILTGTRLLGLNEKVETFYRALMSYKAHYRILVKAFLCSLLIQGGVILGYIILARGMGMGVSMGYFFLFIPLATVVAMIPLSLSGLGIREGAFVFLFARVGAAEEQALALSLIWFAGMALLSLFGGVEYIRAGGKKEIGPVLEDREPK